MCVCLCWCSWQYAYAISTSHVLSKYRVSRERSDKPVFREKCFSRERSENYFSLNTENQSDTRRATCDEFLVVSRVSRVSLMTSTAREPAFTSLARDTQRETRDKFCHICMSHVTHKCHVVFLECDHFSRRRTGTALKVPRNTPGVEPVH